MDKDTQLSFTEHSAIWYIPSNYILFSEKLDKQIKFHLWKWSICTHFNRTQRCLSVWLQANPMDDNSEALWEYKSFPCMVYNHCLPWSIPDQFSSPRVPSGQVPITQVPIRTSSHHLVSHEDKFPSSRFPSEVPIRISSHHLGSNQDKFPSPRFPWGEVPIT